ncbi:MAG: diacylglycerol kinase family lipid kinase [Streptosporangiales bacterium]|nr:diacylglycerol kinase family lipid kinase [Streptosporangiales bacterium]
MRALLIINPRATSISGRVVGRVAQELGSSLELDTTQTRYRGHARELAATAGGYDLLVPLGGDGTVNEVVNGLMERKESRPALAPVPGGGANVFARTLGLPADPVGAARQISAAVRAGLTRTIGLGLAMSGTGDRHFMFSAGLGVDAEVVADMERIRASGQKESAPLFVWTGLRRYYTGTDRRNPALTLEPDGYPTEAGLFMGIVTNSAPWTYLGDRPVRSAPRSDLRSGLDVFALRHLRTLSTLMALGQMMRTDPQPVSGKDLVTAVGLPGLVFQASRPVAFHIDGEYLGETEKVAFRHLPAAMRVIALPM